MLVYDPVRDASKLDLLILITMKSDEQEHDDIENEPATWPAGRIKGKLMKGRYTHNSSCFCFFSCDVTPGMLRL